MFVVSLLACSSLRDYILLVKPGLRQRLLTGGVESNLSVWGASLWGHPAGIAVVNWKQESAQLLDLYVLPSYRQAGIGTALLAAVEAQMRQLGVSLITALYRVNEHTPRFESVLLKQGWTPPNHRATIFWTTRENGIVNSRWVRRYRFRPPYQVVAWADSSPTERQTVEERGRAGWYPKNLSPFQRAEDTWDPETSLALRFKGEIVGWALTVRESPTRLLVDILFVDPPLQRLGRGFMLIGEVIRHSSRIGIEETYWRVDPANEPMLRWSRRAFADALADEYDEWYSEKKLVPKAFAA